ncbi:MAG TPA: hypothetical protein PKV16_08610 [Caldisericia bacterium]|nr:hypothetical protein [Caldisericia bacterium]HPF49336.1 hypothetical protein [Caldisericia bacterium]HPI84412.1 hypothetical protein [Caldisericia bacterium]HPQ93827.1 hypothetical protein [Caldisericia bacterium]HRV75609.1 hypothetical protein [Caldisericia bacterium]
MTQCIKEGMFISYPRQGNEQTQSGAGQTHLWLFSKSEWIKTMESVGFEVALDE